MAHSNRNKQKEKRKAHKAAIKAAKKALYESMAGKPSNKKKKGQGGKGVNVIKPARILMTVLVKERGVLVPAQRKVHGGSSCPNIGCKRCSKLWEVQV